MNEDYAYSLLSWRSGKGERKEEGEEEQEKEKKNKLRLMELAVVSDSQGERISQLPVRIKADEQEGHA